MAVFTLFMVGAAGIASAQTNYGNGGTSGSAATSNDNPSPGQQVIVSGEGFQPGSTVTLVLGNVTVRVKANAAGRFSGGITVPCGTAPGQQTITATGTGTNGASRTLTATITVRDGKCIGGNLPRTGSSSTVPLTAAGFGLVAIGGGALIVARRRRSTIAAS